MIVYKPHHKSRYRCISVLQKTCMCTKLHFCTFV